MWEEQNGHRAPFSESVHTTKHASHRKKERMIGFSDKGVLKKGDQMRKNTTKMMYVHGSTVVLNKDDQGVVTVVTCYGGDRRNLRKAHKKRAHKRSKASRRPHFRH